MDTISEKGCILSLFSICGVTCLGLVSVPIGHVTGSLKQRGFYYWHVPMTIEFTHLRIDLVPRKGPILAIVLYNAIAFDN